MSRSTARSTLAQKRTALRLPTYTEGGEGGFTLAALMVMIMVMSITMAVAVPSWTNWVQRDKEAEAIFRGMQYAEAIRVFQQRHGRPPTTLEELIKVEPRSIRQLYPNPLNESGRWGLLMRSQTGGSAAANQQPAAGNNPANGNEVATVGAGGIRVNRDGTRAPARNRNRTGPVVAIPPTKEGEENPSGGRLSLGAPTQRTAGPLVGVYPGITGQALRSFNGATSYDAWRFQADLIPAPVLLGGDSAAPRVTSEWIGKAFRSDIQPNNQNQGNQPGGLNRRGIGQGSAPKGNFSPGQNASSFRPGSNRNDGQR